MTPHGDPYPPGTQAAHPWGPPGIPNPLQAVVDAQRAQIDALTALLARGTSVEKVAALETKIALLREMVALLTEAERSSLGYLHAHGWRTDPASVERGKQIREQLATLDDKAAP